MMLKQYKHTSLMDRQAVSKVSLLEIRPGNGNNKYLLTLLYIATLYVKRIMCQFSYFKLVLGNMTIYTIATKNP